MKFKIKDKIILILTCATVPTLILNGFDYLLIRLHLNKWHMWQISGSLFFNIEDLTTIPALIIGVTAQMILINLVTATLFYLLYYTGRKFYIIKGIAVLLFSWLILFGGILRLNITAITQPIGAQANMVNLIFHIIDGMQIGILMIKLADQRLWD